MFACYLNVLNVLMYVLMYDECIECIDYEGHSDMTSKTTDEENLPKLGSRSE